MNESEQEKLIVNNLRIVRTIAARLSGVMKGKVEYKELYGYGILGLIDAVDRYDTNMKNKFETYAYLRIRGAIIDELRRIDWVPRSVRNKVKQVDEANRELEQELGRTVTEMELANKLGISIDELNKRISGAVSYNVISFEQLIEEGHEVLDSDRGILPGHRIETEEIKDLLKSSIGELREIHQMVVNLYYYEELTYKEIAKVMGVSESRISQLHSIAMVKLRNKVKGQLVG